ARGPEHGQELAPPHLEVEPVEGQGAVAERLADAAQGDDGPLAHGRGLSSSPTFLLTNWVVSDFRMSTVGLVTPALTIASMNSRMRAPVMAPMPIVTASPQSTIPTSFILVVE